MLIKFLCDADMLAKVMPFIILNHQEAMRAQDAELSVGGPDLVKLDFDPMLLTRDDFNKLVEFKTNMGVFAFPGDTKFPLLENLDEILYWKDVDGKVNFYYVNKETKTVIPIVPTPTTDEEQHSLDALIASFDTMEKNSARRSTNKEHQLISKLMQHSLQRQGIFYREANGEAYRGSQTPLYLMNRYRTSIRLYEEAAANGEWEKAHQYWREGVGQAQGEELWLLQRICEPNLPFHTLPREFGDFMRGFAYHYWCATPGDSVFKKGRLVPGLGTQFTLSKGYNNVADGAEEMGDGSGVALEMVGVCRFIEDAKTKIIELTHEAELVFQAGVENSL